MSSRKSVEHIIERMAIGAKNAARIAGNDAPGFNHALRLAVNHIDPDRNSWDKNEKVLTSRYKVVPQLCWNGSSASLSTCLALIDEHTTQAIFGAKPKVLLAGVSVHLQADLYRPVPVGTEVDIVSSVTRMGRNLAFCSAELRGLDGTVHCRGAHVKYLPADNFLLNTMLSSTWAWPYMKAYFDRVPDIPPSDRDESLKALIDPHLNFKGPGEATFDVLTQHTNPFATLHGGCNAILLEMVGQQVADVLFDGPSQLSSMQVQYHTVGKGQVEVKANVVSQNETDVLMHVLVKRLQDGRIISDGSLRWSRNGVGQMSKP